MIYMQYRGVRKLHGAIETRVVNYQAISSMWLTHQVPVLAQIQATTNHARPSNQPNELSTAYDYHDHVLP